MNEAEHQAGARALAEAIYEAYVQTATMPPRRMAEQSVVTRLVEALEPLAESGEDAMVEAANATLDGFEGREPEIRGPRVQSLDLATGRVALKPR